MDHQLDNAPCGYASFTDDGTLTAVNTTLARQLDLTREELEGRHIESMLTVAGRIFYQTHLFPLVKLHGKAEEIFLTLRGKAGKEVPMLTNVSRRESDGRFVNDCVLMPIPQRRKYEDEILAAKRQAEEALQTNEDFVRIRAELERHARELDRKVSRLEQKNTELMRFSTILAHDLREPIRKLSVFADILGKEHHDSLSSMGLRAVEVIGGESIRLSVLVRGLHEYISVDGPDERVEQVELADTLRAAHKVVAHRYGIDLDLSQGPLPAVEGNRRQLELLFTHLLDNAVKFSGPGVAPRVSVTSREVQENSFRATEGRYRYVDCVLIAVEDHGIGFEERYSTYVFEALRKLDTASAGVGLGLAICKKVAENHFGWIKAEPIPEAGSRFTVMLPLRQ